MLDNKNTSNVIKKKPAEILKGRGASRLISDSALLGWEDDDYDKVNKKLIDYGNKYKEIVYQTQALDWKKNFCAKKRSSVIFVNN